MKTHKRLFKLAVARNFDENLNMSRTLGNSWTIWYCYRMNDSKNVLCYFWSICFNCLSIEDCFIFRQIMMRYHFYRNVLKLAEKVKVVAIWWHATTSGKTGSPRDELNIKVIKSKAWKRLSGHCPHLQKKLISSLS